jgi:hypothetical protein
MVEGAPRQKKWKAKKGPCKNGEFLKLEGTQFFICGGGGATIDHAIATLRHWIPRKSIIWSISVLTS